MPELSSLKDLIVLSEKDEKVFQFAHLDNDDTVFFGELEMPIAEISVEKAASVLSRLDDKLFFPMFPETGITPAPEDEIATCYIKRPAIEFHITFGPHNAHLIPNTLMDEALIMEVLRQHPHPNMIRYLGCKLRRGRITGIVLEKHRYDLPKFLNEHNTPIATPVFDKQAFMSSLSSAIHHLHSLGYAHNDLNPGNILVSAECAPILVDFGSSRRIGESLSTSRGTVGWYEGRIEDYNMSEKENDMFALERIRA